MSLIHPTAIVGSGVRLAPDVTVGPYTIIDGDIEIAAGGTVGAHSWISGHCKIGRNARIGPGVFIGGPPQHASFDTTLPTWTVIGNNVTLRETATIHRSTRVGIENATSIGDDCYLMTASHVAHDCHVGVGVTFASDAKLGGHVTIGDKAFIGGGVGVHQNCRIGRLAILASNELITQDVPPYAAVRYGRLKGYNAIGCRRAGLPQDAIFTIRSIYRCLKKHRTRPRALEAIAALDSNQPQIHELVDFILASKRGVLRSDRGVEHAHHHLSSVEVA